MRSILRKVYLRKCKSAIRGLVVGQLPRKTCAHLQKLPHSSQNDKRAAWVGHLLRVYWLPIQKLLVSEAATTGVNPMHAGINIVEALWVSHPIIEIPLAGIMYRRNLHRQFPVFFCYILFQVVQFFILSPIFRSDRVPEYFFAYWLSALVCWILGFKILHEAFSDVFRPFHAPKDIGTVMMRWTGVLLALSAIVFYASAAGPVTSLLNIMIALQRCVRFTQCALILFLLTVSRYLGVSWRRQSIGIALGFGWFAGVEPLASTQFGRPIFNLLNIAAYTLALIVWIGYAAVSEPNDLPNFDARGRSVVPSRFLP